MSLGAQLDGIEEALTARGIPADKVDAIMSLVGAVLRPVERDEGLTPTQSAIVAMLRGARGAILHGDQLANATGTDGNTVKVLICKARARRPELRERIVTVWVAGYRWRDSIEDSE